MYKRQASVQVEHDGIGALVGVRNIGHEVRVNGVTAVRAARVVEIYDVEKMCIRDSY